MGGRILFVEDENSAHFAVREYFTAKGFSVDCARDREEALGCLSTGRYAVVIADLRLSENRAMSCALDGLEIVERVRREHPGTRVLVLTACGAELEPEALRRGADCFLQKPQSLARVAGIVERLVRDAS
jgi:DNA-binding response OmpR family regulator